MNENYREELIITTLQNEADTSIIKMFMTLKGTCVQDGNEFSAVIGDLPTGCAGFAKTRHQAIMNCMHNFCNEKAVSPPQNEKKN